MTDSYELRFIWPHPEPNDVVVTGTFDNWTSSVHLKRTQSGFEGTVRVPWSTKVLYKYVVDGNWITHESQPTEVDSAGFVNNVTYTPDKPAAPEIEKSKKKLIPAAPPAPAKEPSAPAPVVPAPAPAPEPKKADEPAVPIEEKDKDVAPTVPVPIEPISNSSTDTTKDKRLPADIPSTATTHTPAPAPEPEPQQKPVEKASPAPAPVATAPEPVPAPPEPELTPAPIKSEEPSVVTPRPTTPPPKVVEAPSAPVNGRNRDSTTTDTTSPPSTPKKSEPQPFPSTEPGDSPGHGSIRSRTGSERKKRPSIIDRIRSVFHKEHSPERTDKTDKKKRHSLFQSHSVSDDT